MEWDPDHPQNQPDLSDYGRALLSRGASWINTFPSLCSSISLLMPCLSFRCCGSRTSPSGTPGRTWSAPLRRTSPLTVWFCAMGWQPHCGCALDACRYISHCSASFTSCLISSRNYKKCELVSNSLNPFPPPTGDLLHCVSRALCGRQNLSVCWSVLHQ